MSFKTRDGKTHQSSVLIGENGLPVDSIATISGSYVFLEDIVNPVVYSGGTVTLPVGADLTALTTAKARYTGKYILLTNSDQLYYIDRQTINVAARSFVISSSDKSQVNPPSIDLSAGWTIAEADIVNRLATTSAAKIDNIEFRDIHFQMELDGDPVTVIDGDGNPVGFATEATQLENKAELQLINDELDTHTIQLQEINDELNSQTGLLTHIDGDLHSAITALADINTELDNIEADTTAIETNTSNAVTQLTDVNIHLQAIEDALAAPLQIAQPVITAGTSNGLVGGPTFIHINNIKNQILASHDRDQQITYADFGTKNQRITRIDYVSATFPSVTARKTLTYVVDGNRYKRTNITWTIV
jgi:hypothetical protein